MMGIKFVVNRHQTPGEKLAKVDLEHQYLSGQTELRFGWQVEGIARLVISVAQRAL
jgi:hypothetical protein